MTTDTLEAPIETIDVNNEAELLSQFPQIEEYEKFLLTDIGIVKWFKADKQIKNGKKITTGYGFIESQNGDVYFRLPACQKPEFDPTTGGVKFVRQYRRVKTGQAVTFAVQSSDRGQRTELFMFWEPSEFEKVAKQVLLGAAFKHRLVRITKKISLAGNYTISVDEDVLWEGTDLDAMRVEVPRTVDELKVHKPLVSEADGIKTLVYQQVQYMDMFDSAGRHRYVTCLDPR